MNTPDKKAGTEAAPMWGQDPTAAATAAHSHAESDITGLTADLAAKENAINKGAVSGYASLDSTGRVPTAQLPEIVSIRSGVPGTQFRSGTTLPAKSLGIEGDFYLHTPTGSLYKKVKGCYRVQMAFAVQQVPKKKCPPTLLHR